MLHFYTIIFHLTDSGNERHILRQSGVCVEHVVTVKYQTESMSYKTNVLAPIHLPV